MITAASLNKQFFTDKGHLVQALNDVSFEVEAGSFFVLLGPSGSGKTTTLRAVAGLETPDTGLLRIGGQAIFDSSQSLIVPPEERPVSMVFQSYALWPHMNVRQNILFPLRHGVRAVARKEAERRFESVIETLQLTPYINRPTSQLSGGQQQRVALARAMALEPSVLLMDEPLSNLDAKLRATLRVEIKNLTRSLGITTLYVTHDQVEAMVMGDHIAVMDKGAIVEEGRPDHLYKHPKSEFVANFLGDMNFVHGHATEVARGGAMIETAIGKLRLPVDGGCCAGAGPVRIGFRPEDISAGEQDQGISFRAQVLQSFYLGDSVSCDLMIGGQKVMARLKNNSTVEQGDEAVFSIMPDDLTVFAGAAA